MSLCKTTCGRLEKSRAKRRSIGSPKDSELLQRPPRNFLVPYYFKADKISWRKHERHSGTKKTSAGPIQRVRGGTKNRSPHPRTAPRDQGGESARSLSATCRPSFGRKDRSNQIQTSFDLKNQNCYRCCRSYRKVTFRIYSHAPVSNERTSLASADRSA